MPSGGKSYSRPPAGAGGRTSKPKPPPKRTYSDAQVKSQRQQLGAKTYTPSKSGGGVWQASNKRIVGTAKTEDSIIKPTQRGRQAPRKGKS